MNKSIVLCDICENVIPDEDEHFALRLSKHAIGVNSRHPDIKLETLAIEVDICCKCSSTQIRQVHAKVK